ncbi:MAG: hypothetical protein HY040_12285 [Planctomycetes bacterium]|nr:hypothetical protein [Planctomycetota bacterium]
MSTQNNMESSEAGVFGRIIQSDRGNLAPELARYLLELRFSETDEARMHELAVKNQEKKLSRKEKEELLGFAKAGCLLGILHSKARKSLKRTTKSSA